MSLIPLLGAFAALGLWGTHLLRPTTRRWTWQASLGLGALLLLSGAWVGLSWAPADQYMGDVQRILYVHVPVLWMGLLALGLNFAASLVFLFTSRPGADALAEAFAEVGVVFGTLGLGIGAVWGKPTWGVWWSWDPRMTATVVMLGLYVTYLVVRRLIPNPEARAFWSASIACLVSIVLPVVWFSVKWWASLHQLQSSRETMDPRMALALGWNGVAFLHVFLVLTWQRYLLSRPPSAA